jgi:hypothetical protein
MDKELMVSKKEEINSLHKEVHIGFKMTLEKVVRIGELLTECKKEIGHGAWMGWVKCNCEFSQTTADNYIRAYERRDDPKLTTVVNLSDIYYPRLEHKPPKQKTLTAPTPEKAVEQEPEKKPQVKEPVILKTEEAKEAEVIDRVDDQDEMLEELKDSFNKLDKKHKNLSPDWVVELFQQAEREAA